MKQADWNLIVAGVILAGFLWLMISALRGAWTHEQHWKAKDAAWTAAHPESQQADTAARRWLNVLGTVVALGAVATLANGYQLNIVQACLIVAAPIVLVRYLRQRRREQNAANHERFGDYVPTFRDRR